MGLLILLQVIFDLAFIATATLLLIERSKSKITEDPKLSRGLQLLSSKIAIIQDLMDRSEVMTKQMNQLLDGKQQDIQEKMEEAEVHIHKMRKATEKSQEAVKIFKEALPHQEILERENSAKYVQAAKMAHQGLTIEDIAQRIDIPRGELELIVKVNRNKIVTGDQTHASQIPEIPKPEIQTSDPTPLDTASLPFTAKVVNSGNKEAIVRPVFFRKIDLDAEFDLPQ